MAVQRGIKLNIFLSVLKGLIFQGNEKIYQFIVF